jgi:hypothetical protein
MREVLMKILYSLMLFLYAHSLYALDKDTPLFGGAYEISRGFFSFFTVDQYMQNLLAGLLSPFFILIFFGIGIYLLIKLVRKYNQSANADIAQGQQLLLFKAKQLGLSDYQFKILKGITDTLALAKPSAIIDDPRLFERSIARSISFAEKMGEKKDSMESICLDLIITYEKLYHHADIRKPLSSFNDLEINTLSGFCTENGIHFVAKLKSFERDKAIFFVFASREKLEKLIPGTDIKGLLWRSGDAEYDYKSVILSVEGNIAAIQNPVELNRGQPVPHPLIDIVIPCNISVKNQASTPSSPVEADIFKLNESEALIRSKTRIEHSKMYQIEFTVSDFTVRSDVLILRERYIADRHVFYYNLKFTDLSEAGRTVIGNHLTTHLFS